MTQIKVNGMSCGGCAAAIKRAISAIDPAAHVEVDLQGKEVRVDGERDTAAVRAAIQSAGYEVA
jgi:copper chaperone